jgi:plastocyanin
MSMNTRTLYQVLLATVLCVSCGGSGGSSGSNASTPTTPSSTGSSNVVTVTITGNNGALSFSPNPAACVTGQTVVWKNADTVTHHIVIDDLGVNTGDIPPGGTSQPMSLGNVSKSYHCSLHPAMVGALNNAVTPTDGPACGPYGC